MIQKIRKVFLDIKGRKGFETVGGGPRLCLRAKEERNVCVGVVHVRDVLREEQVDVLGG